MILKADGYMLVMKHELERWREVTILLEAGDNQEGASKAYLPGRELMNSLDKIVAVAPDPIIQ